MLLLGRRAHILGGDDEKFLTGRLVHISDAMLSPKFRLQLTELTPVACTMDELVEGLTVDPSNSGMLSRAGSEFGPRGFEVKATHVYYTLWQFVRTLPLSDELGDPRWDATFLDVVEWRAIGW